MSELGAFEVLREGGIAEVTLIGPGKGNALGPEFFMELPRLFEELDGDREVRVVIVVGRGENFSYGLDLSAVMAELGPYLMGPKMAAERSGLLDVIRRYQLAVTVMERCRKPVIAAIDGWCIGGGLDLAAACDVRICSKKARFSLREVKVAIVADLGSLQRLPAIIGQGNTRQLALTGEDIDSARALQIGLVTQVLGDHEELLQGARAMAQKIAENPPLVVQGIKQVMNHGAHEALARELDFVAVWNAAFLQSLDLMEAFTAFRQKREPQFAGR